MMNQVIWSPGVTLEQIEKQVILNAYRFYRGIKSTTAQSLGIAIRTLESKLEKYEQDGEAQRQAEALEDANRVELLKRARGVHNQPDGSTRILGTNSGAHETITAGLYEKPAVEARPVHDVPVPKREETKVLLPENARASGSHRRR